MTQTLERRVEVLEQTAHIGDEPIMIFITFISPGHLQVPAVRATCEEMFVIRSTNETDDAFRNRVEREVRAAKPDRPAYQVFLHPAEQRGEVRQ